MQSISINLLPPELRIVKEQEVKRSKYNKVSISILVVTIFLMIGALILKTTQFFNIQAIKDETTVTQTKISSYKTQEGLIYLLQDRLSTIQKTRNQEATAVISFNLIEKLLVPGITISTFRVENDTSIQLNGEATSLGSLQEFFDNLVDKDLTEGRIIAVKVNNLGTSSSSNILFDLTLTQNNSQSEKKP